MSDPYSLDTDEWLTDFKFRVYAGFAAASPLAQAKVMPVSYSRELILVVRDPACRWATSWREWLRQVRDIVMHEFWMAQGRPERSPGARYE